MTIDTKTSNGKENLTISVTGIFDFQFHDDFRAAYLDTRGLRSKVCCRFFKDRRYW
jgi:hypothetical protein